MPSKFPLVCHWDSENNPVLLNYWLNPGHLQTPAAAQMLRDCRNAEKPQRKIRRRGERDWEEGHCNGLPSPTFPALGSSCHYPLPGLVFKEWLDERVQGMNVPGLVDEMDSSKAGRKAVLGWKERNTVSVEPGPARPQSGGQPVFSRKLSLMWERQKTHPSYRLRCPLFPLPCSPTPLPPQLTYRTWVPGLPFPSHNYVSTHIAGTCAAG